jgi:predicted XRE-type DNA-binding protein
MTSNELKTKGSNTVIEGSGNVFADLGFEDPTLELAKAVLAHSIARVIESRRLTQTQAADLTGLDQPKISSILRGRLGGFSIERLVRTLTALGQDVEITVRDPKHGEVGHVTVNLETAVA